MSEASQAPAFGQQLQQQQQQYELQQLLPHCLQAEHHHLGPTLSSYWMTFKLGILGCCIACYSGLASWHLVCFLVQLCK